MFKTWFSAAGAAKQWAKAALGCASVACSGFAFAQCGPVDLSKIAQASSIGLAAGVTVNGLSPSGSGNILSATGVLSSATVSPPAPIPAAFPTFPKGPNGSGSSIAPGTYNIVSGSPIGFTGDGGVYYITSLASGTSSSFGPGTYYIKTWTAPTNGSSITVSGPVKIYLGSGGFSGSGSSLLINSAGASSNLMIYLYSSSFTLGASGQISAEIASNSASGSVALGSSVQFTGSIQTSGALTVGLSAKLLTGSSSSANATSCPLVASYRFDETKWTGSSADVLDSGGSGFNGTSSIAAGTSAKPTTVQGAPAYSSGSQNTCGYGLFDPSPAQYGYVSLPSGYPVMSGSFTASAWFNSANVGQSGQRIWVQDDNDDGWALSLGDKGGGGLRFFNRKISPTGATTGTNAGTNNACGTTYCLDSPALTAGVWYYGAVSLDASASSATLYVLDQTGAVVSTTTSSFTGTAAGYTGATAIGGESSASTEGRQSGFHFLGSLDEAVMFYGALDKASLIAQAKTARTCASALGSFVISGTGGTASTCSPPSPQNITVKALTAAGLTFTGYSGTVALSTSTGHGTWTLVTGSGAFTPGSSDSGSASYVFSASEAGQGVFGLSDSHAETLSVGVSDAVALVSATSTSETFLDNAFVVLPTDPLGYQVVAGRAHAFTASFYKKDATTGVCSVAAGYSGTKALDLWYEPTASHPAAAAAPKISASAASGVCGTSVALPSSAPAVNAASNLMSLNFSSGVASFYLCPADVGQYAIGARDDTLSFSQTVVSGLSSTATSRPFGLFIDQVKYGALSNSGGTSFAGSPFAPAQAAFSARVSAKLWGPGQDSLVSGTPDLGVDLSSNGNTAGFGASTVLAAFGQTPATGTLGALGGASIAAGSFSSGVASLSSLTYAEAGSMKLGATSLNYLSSSFAVPGVVTGNIGRFYAAAFNLSSASSVGAACASGGFTYMAQPFAASTSLTAVGASGGALSNYDASKGYGYLLAPTWRGVDAQSGVDFGGRLVMGAAPAWSSGMWVFSSSAALFSRLATPDGQYDSLQLGLSGSDSDGATIAGLDMSYSAAGACSGISCNAKMVGTPMKMRFGRLEVQSANASILPQVRVAVLAKYWSKTAGGASLGWTPNSLDSCTAVPYADMSVGAFSGSVASASLPSGSLMLSAGLATLVATRPGGAAVGGSAVVAFNLGNSAASPGGGCAAGLPSVPGAGLQWLQSNFCSGSTQVGNPAGRMVWGAAQSKSNSIVIMREQY